jgi:hypothetical protein
VKDVVGEVDAPLWQDAEIIIRGKHHPNALVFFVTVEYRDSMTERTKSTILGGCLCGEFKYQIGHELVTSTTAIASIAGAPARHPL